MKPTQLILRCYAEHSDGMWRAVCLDLNLVAEATTIERVQEKLTLQISEYLHDALVGQDTPYASQLIPRRAPLKYWARYWAVRIRNVLNKPQSPGANSAYECPMPLQPCM